MKNTTNPLNQNPVYSHKTRVILSSFKSISLLLFLSLLLQNCGIIMSLLPTGGKKDNKFLLLPLALQGGTRGTTNNATGTGSGTGTGSTTGTGNAPPAGSPTASPAAGHYNTPQTINFSTTASGGVVRCTTNGTDPTSATPTWTPTHIWFLAGLDIKCGTYVNGALTGTIQTFTYSYPPLKSGQTSCWDDGGNSISCSGTGQDGETQNGVERSYTNNGDGTITDNATGLVWQRCSVGQSGASCGTGSATGMTWATATGTTCTSLTTGGRTWRLPTSIELGTLPDYGTWNPAINTGFFPNTVANGYWSSTTYAPGTSSAWVVYFADGVVGTFGKTGNYHVHCVSGEMKSSTPFTDNGDGTIKDKATGLVWQKCSVGQGNDATCSGSASVMQWSTALTPCSGLTLAGKTWRLPSVKELQSIVDKTLSTSPSINTSIFPNTVAGVYWSSTTYAPNTTVAWLVSFIVGSVSYSGKGGYSFVRCVSGP